MADSADSTVIKEMSNSVGGSLNDWLVDFDMNETVTEIIYFSIITAVLAVVCFIVDFIARKLLLKVVEQFVKKTKTDWDDALLEKKVFHGLAHIAPVFVVYLFGPLLFHEQGVRDFILKYSHIALVAVLLLVAFRFIDAAKFVASKSKVMKDKPTGSYAQLTKLLIGGVGAIYVIALLIEKSAVGIFSALGAMSVILMLVFKDTILGFVASIQMSANDMVKIGDWVEFPKYGADGNVIEINLNTVKVQNWDKTITTVPTYAFVSDAFKNWRGMEESGGRRIRRAILIDIDTIKVCDENLLEKLRKIRILEDYLSLKSDEIEKYNKENGIDDPLIVNGRRITNIGTFRAYIVEYLKRNPMISQEMTFLIRQLEPTDKGVPLQIYVFSKEQRWVEFEAIQSNIFDHLLAVMKEFDLKPFQSKITKAD